MSGWEAPNVATSPEAYWEWTQWALALPWFDIQDDTVPLEHAQIDLWSPDVLHTALSGHWITEDIWVAFRRPPVRSLTATQSATSGLNGAPSRTLSGNSSASSPVVRLSPTPWPASSSRTETSLSSGRTARATPWPFPASITWFDSRYGRAMRRPALFAAVAAALVLAGCASTPAEPVETPEVSYEASYTRPPVSTPIPEPSPSSTPTLACTDDCQYTAEEGSYLTRVVASLPPDYFEQYKYLGSEGVSQYWLDMGYALCGMLDSGMDRQQVVDFVAPNYINPRLYGEGFAETLVDGASGTLCA